MTTRVNNLFGAKIDNDFNRCLSKDHKFSWESILESPKEQREIQIDAGSYFMKPMNYHILHCNGFIRLATKRGRVYWLVQNSKEHRLPDWKFHVSVNINDLPRAWNIVAAIFMEARCELGMKATTGEDWPTFQHGREITIYAYSHCFEYQQNYLTEESILDSDFRLGLELETIYNTLFWFVFLRKVEKYLTLASIQSNGTADGDFLLPGMKYVSLRNEAFVTLHGVPSYPPNEMGYNPSNQSNPFLELIYYLKTMAKLNTNV